MTIKTKLQQARNLIQNGWTQRQKRDVVNNSYCLLGALDQVSGPEYGHMQEIVGLKIIAKEFENKKLASCMWLSDDYSRVIVGWNDTKSRTKDEVLAVLDKAIESVPE